MSSAVISTSAAQGRFFVFDEETPVGACPIPGDKKLAGLQESIPDSVLTRVFQSTIGLQKSAIENCITPASRLTIRPTPPMVPSGIPELDALTGGLPRGCLTEICGPASSGRTAVLLAALAAATCRGEFCAVIDASDALDPNSAAAAGVALDRLLWVRCDEYSSQRHPSTSLRAGSDTEKAKSKDSESGRPISRAPFAREAGISSQTTLHFDETKSRAENRLEQVLRATDLLLESGGFGLIALDLADLPPESARRIPLTTWFRFRRAIEHKPTILLAIEQHPIAGSCSSLLLRLGASTQYPAPSSKPAHMHLLTGLRINVELIYSRMDRMPARSTIFESRTAWAG